jgi:hypothetical protein
LPTIGIKYLDQLFNAVLLGVYFTPQWKVVQIIFILEPENPSNELTSYRPISLLPTVSKVFEKMLLKRILSVVENNRLITNHQFGFRQRHYTIQHTHRIVQRINEALENKQYCSAAFFLYISSIRQSMAYCTSVQVKTVSPSELFPYPNIPFT